MNRPPGPAGRGTAGCVCASAAVPWWGGRETLALRQALRMSLRAFAEHLGVNVNTVCRWEDRRMPASPNTLMQSLLDQALKLADTDARARFWLILPDAAVEADKWPDETAPQAAGTLAVLRGATAPNGDWDRHGRAAPGHGGNRPRHGPGTARQARPV